MNLTRGLESFGFRTRLIAGPLGSGEGDMSWYARENGVDPTFLPAMAPDVHPVRDLRSLLALRRLFDGERPDIVHTHTAKAGVLGRVAAASVDVPIRIHTFHGHVLGGDYVSGLRNRAFTAVERRIARESTRLVVLTRAQQREMAERLHIADAGKFAVVPLGLDLSGFRQLDAHRSRAAARAGFGIGPEERVVGIVGHLAPVKNHELMLDAFARLCRADGPPWRLVIVGGGQDREEVLRERTRRLGIEGRVLWLGWRRDLTPVYPVMDVVALTSRDEGTPIALLEALAAGIPVAARAVGGVPEVLEEGRLGELVEEDDPEAMAVAVSRALHRTVDDATRDQVVRSFAVERLCSDVAALYREELEKEGGRQVDRSSHSGSFRA